MKKVRVRFAPSPTGFLHVGSLRTVLFNYLIAKKYNGRFILRIEDTDEKRKVEGAVENLLDILNWVGLEFDEGPHCGGDYGPYIQTERKEIYTKYINQLLKEEKVYRCFCTSERLQKMREDQQAKKLPPRYDRTCRDLSREEIKEEIKAGNEYVVRQKMPLNGEIIAYDELRGEIKFNAEEMDDQVLIKSNGIPTYQFANVIDDHLMEISHVVRGEEWIPSFPKNVLLYTLLGWEPPKFIHMALTLNKEGGKLSKRQGDVAVEDYRQKGYLPEAMNNFSVLLGWHPKDDEEILSMSKMIEKFEIKDMGISPAIFDIDKLDYFNGYYIRQKDLDELTRLCIPYLENAEFIKNDDDEYTNLFSNEKINFEYIKNVVRLEQERLKKLSEIGELTKFFFVDILEYETDLLIWKKLTQDDVLRNLKLVYKLLENIPSENWTNDSIEEAIISHIKLNELKVGDHLWPMRVALTGEKASPGPFDVAEVLGKAITLKRLTHSIEKL